MSILTPAQGNTRHDCKSDKRWVCGARTLLVTLTCLVLPLHAAPKANAVPEWKIEFPFGKDLFPSYILATATMQTKDDPSDMFIGDPNGFIRVLVKNTKPDAKIRVRVDLDTIAKKTTLVYTLKKTGTYTIAPRVQYQFEKLLDMKQPIPINAVIGISTDGEHFASRQLTLKVRSINDAPYAVKGEGGKRRHIDWVFGAYVNENHPGIDRVLQNALKTGKTKSFVGYQRDPETVLKQIDAIWTTLAESGIRYSSITRSSGVSDVVSSQHVRFVSESIEFTQANCIDGTVLLASVLRKIGLDPIIVLVPGHAFLGVYLEKGKKGKPVFIETTMIGSRTLKDAITAGEKNYKTQYIPNKEKAETLLIDVDVLRKRGIAPISK